MDLQDEGSPYITDVGIVPPSPDLNRPQDFEPVLDFASPPFADSTGSYNNSPFSNHSELSFVTAENDLSFDIFADDHRTQGLFDTIGPATISGGNDFEYDPAEYDPPHSGSSLLMYSDNDYISPSYHSMASPDHQQQHHRAGSVPYDHSSPSSNGDTADRRSRASSVSSAYQGQQQQQQSTQFSHSPRLDVAHSFENMTVRSPNWGNEPLPQQKPHSPPRLMMPETFGLEGQDLPTINAPDGDGAMGGGPQLHIVPATPIGTAGNGAPFQNNSAQELSQSQPNWGIGTGGQSQSNPSEPNSRQPSPFRFPSQADSSSSQSNVYPSAPNETANFLFPQQQPRGRSKSDNALETPSWDQSYLQQQQQLHRGGDNSALGLDINMTSRSGDDGGVSSTTSSINVDNTSPSYQMQTFTFGSSNDRNGYLSPDSQSQFNMRRTKSDSGSGRPLGHRQSRSEDIRGLAQQQPHLHQQQQGGIGALQHQQRQHPQQQQAFMHHSSPNSSYHGHSLSLSASQGGMLYPPPNDFMGLSNPSQLHNPNLLGSHGGGGLPLLPPIRSLSPGSRGHIRRASSGSRSERGVGAEQWLSSYSGSARASPYPSPNASPRVRFDELELDLERENNLEIPAAVSSAGFENEVALSGRMGMMAASVSSAGDHKTLDVNNFLGTAAMSTLGLVGAAHESKPITVAQVSKPNVTTLRTATASHKRRKQEAGFVCPFPGCGSTFTRSFNLKGHIRSHNEEKPFVCHWPGCGKGFARQHDCKRHEQLHTNYRPFTCEGCNRQFARMDALNRHLRSEGGAECAKTQGIAVEGSASTDVSSNRTTPAEQSPSPKVEAAQTPPQRSTSRVNAQDHYGNLGGGGMQGWGANNGTAIGVSL